MAVMSENEKQMQMKKDPYPGPSRLMTLGVPYPSIE
jgi:hypothetical protein